MFIRRLFSVALLSLFSSCLSAKTISITVHPVVEKQVEQRIETVGTVESLQSPVVAAELTAKVVDIQVRIGDKVTPQTLLATLDSSSYELQLAEAQAELRRLDAMLKLQSRQVKRYMALLNKKGIDKATYDKSVSEKAAVVSEYEYAQAKVSAAQLRVQQAQIYSPIDGVVDERMVSIGSYVVPGKPLFRVVGVEQLRARLPFSEQRYADIKAGQTVYLTSAVSSGAPIKATIDYLRPQIEAQSRAIEVFVNFENEQAWLPGASVNAELVVQRQPQALVVPVQSVVERPAGQVVYVVHEQDNQSRIEERPISTGLVSAKGVQVLSGLQAGEFVAVDGARFLSAGADVEVQR